MADYISTYTGIHFYPAQPDAEGICIEDIAHALSYLCRGNGHVSKYWSVAQHCILCAREAAAREWPDRLVLACLLHDASECYLSDVPRPFKSELTGYREHEERLLQMIYVRYLGSPLTDEERRMVREIDDGALFYDLKELLHNEQSEEDPQFHVVPSYEEKPFAEVEKEYLAPMYSAEAKVDGELAIAIGTNPISFVEVLDDYFKFSDKCKDEFKTLRDGDMYSVVLTTKIAKAMSLVFITVPPY